MAENNKIQTLLDMQEHPENYSERELEAMLEDSDMRGLMEATALLKQAMTWERADREATKADAGWRHFAEAHDTDTASRRSWRKIAAAGIGVLFMSGIAFAAIHVVRYAMTDAEPKPQETQMAASHRPVPPASGAKSDTIPMPVPLVFDNVTLDSIARDIAGYHHIDVDLQNGQAKQLRFYFVWKQDESLEEVIDKLNMFEHVRMTLENGKLIVR